MVLKVVNQLTTGLEYKLKNKIGEEKIITKFKLKFIEIKQIQIYQKIVH